MRLVSGGAQGASLADHWAFMRDSGQRAASPCEVQAFADMVAPMPPSRAHIKRIRRERPLLTAPRENVKLSQSPDDAFRKAQRAILIDAGVVKLDDGVREPLIRPIQDRTFVDVALTDRQRADRVAQFEAEYHRLARYQPRHDDTVAYNGWQKQREFAYKRWQKAEEDFANAG